MRIITGGDAEKQKWSHKEGGSARVTRDENDVKTVMTTIDNMLDPFIMTEELTSI